MSVKIRNQIVRACTPFKDENIFCIGSFGRIVTFYSQQIRAINLVFSLHKKKMIPSDKPCAIIGGGITGITAAFALHRLGYEVDIFEAKPEPVSHLLLTDHRLIHPTINSWPNEKLLPFTNLPFLNWVSGPCSKVSSELLAQVEEVQFSSKNIRIHRRSAPTDVDRSINGYVLSVQGSSISPHAFGTVIICIGFGPEKPNPSFSDISYWRPDSVEHDAIDGSTKHFFVSGCGDGGLIDALRIIHRDFNKGGLIFESAHELEGTEIASRVQKLKTVLDPAEEHATYIELARKIESESQYKDLHQRLAKSAHHGRPIARLSRRKTYPFQGDAAPIHKLLVAHAMNMNRVIFESTEIKLIDEMVHHGSKKYPDSPESLVITRNGPKPTDFGRLIPSKDLVSLSKKQIEMDSTLREPIWDQRIFEEKGRTIIDSARRLRVSAARAFKLLDRSSRVTPTDSGFKVTVDDEAKAKLLPRKIFNFDVEIAVPPSASE